MTPMDDANAKYRWHVSDGLYGVADTREEAERMMEKYTESHIESFITRKSPDGGTTYYYRTKAEADVERAGAFAKYIVRVEEVSQ